MSSTVVPTLRYRDAHRMIGWLCEVFGFARHAVYEDGQGGIAHAQLTLGSGMIMLGSARDDEFGRLQSTPTALGGTTQSPYLVVSNADEVYRRAKAARAEIVIEIKDEVYRRAKAARAEIVIEIKDEDYGGRGFSCRDPEGHLWNVGSYDPWQTPSRRA